MEGISRLVPRTAASDIATMITMILSLPRSSLNVEDAIVVAPGMGEDWRLTAAVRLWQSGNHRHFIVVGVNWMKEVMSRQVTLPYLMSNFDLVKTEGVHIHGFAHHSCDQAEWLVKKTRALGLKSLLITTSAYHLPRFYLTVLKAFLRVGLNPPPMSVHPVSVPRGVVIPESGIDAWDSMPGEIARMEQYQQKGDVATYEELRSYLSGR